MSSTNGILSNPARGRNSTFPPQSGKDLDRALVYNARDFSVIPVKADGSKSPAVVWKSHQEGRANEALIRAWYKRSRYGIGLVCGAVSDNLSVLDFETRDGFVRWAYSLPDPLRQILFRCPIVRTPGHADDGPGIHVYVRTPEPADTAKLALAADGSTLIEVKGEGSYVIAPGSPAACHPQNREYAFIKGGPDHIPRLSPEQWEQMLAAALALNEFRPEPISGELPVAVDPASLGSRPGDVLNARASWEDILAPAGWEADRTCGTVGHWRRPGKMSGSSATTGYCVSDTSGELLWVFSTSAAPFEAGKSYTKFAAYTYLYFAGDFRRAARAAAVLGYPVRSP